MISGSAFSQAKSKLPVPPNGIWLRDSLFIDKTEITNISWLEFMHYQAKDSSETIYKNALPDTSAWLSFQDTLRVNLYLRSPAYRNFPVTGISYEQAVHYCYWRSQAVNLLYATPEGKKRLHIRNDQEVIFRFRLPAEKEWIEAASGSLDVKKYPYGYPAYGSSPRFKEKDEYYYDKTNKTVAFDVFKKELNAYRKSKDEPFFNTVKAFKSYFEYGDYAPRSVQDERTKANPLGVEDMIGNVAEMVAEKGIAKEEAGRIHWKEEKLIRCSFTPGRKHGLASGVYVKCR